MDNFEFNVNTNAKDDEAVLLANLLNKNIDKESALYIIEHQHDDVIRTGKLPLDEKLALAVLALKEHFSLKAPLLSIYDNLLSQVLKRYTFAKFTEGIFLAKIDKKSIVTFIEDCISLNLNPFTDAIKVVIDDDYRFQTVLTVHGFTKLLNDSGLSDGYKFKEKDYKDHSLSLYKGQLPRICECHLYRKDRRKSSIGASFLAEFEKADNYTTTDDLNLEQSMRLLAFCRAISMSFGIKVGIELGLVTFADIFNISRAINFNGFRLKFEENIISSSDFDCEDTTFNQSKKPKDFVDEIESFKKNKVQNSIEEELQTKELKDIEELDNEDDDIHAAIDSEIEQDALNNTVNDAALSEQLDNNDVDIEHAKSFPHMSKDDESFSKDESSFDEDNSFAKEDSSFEDSVENIVLDDAINNRVKDLAKANINKDEDISNSLEDKVEDNLNKDLSSTENEEDKDSFTLSNDDNFTLENEEVETTTDVRDYIEDDLELLTPANDVSDSIQKDNIEKSSEIVKNCVEGMLDEDKTLSFDESNDAQVVDENIKDNDLNLNKDTSNDISFIEDEKVKEEEVKEEDKATDDVDVNADLTLNIEENKKEDDLKSLDSTEDVSNLANKEQDIKDDNVDSNILAENKEVETKEVLDDTSLEKEDDTNKKTLNIQNPYNKFIENKIEDFIEAVTEVPSNYIIPKRSLNDVELVLDKVNLKDKQSTVTLIQEENVTYFDKDSIPTIDFDEKAKKADGAVDSDISFSISEDTDENIIKSDTFLTQNNNQNIVDKTLENVVFKDLNKNKLETQFEFIQEPHLPSTDNVNIDDLDDEMLDKLTSPDSSAHVSLDLDSKFSDKNSFFNKDAVSLNNEYNSHSKYIFSDNKNDKKK